MDFEMRKRTEVLKQAGELARLGADVAVVIVSSDGANIYTFSMPNMITMIARCLDSVNYPAFHLFTPERGEMQVPVDLDVLRVGVQMLKQTQMKLLDEDLGGMDLDELNIHEEQLKERLRCLKDIKAQLLNNQLLQSIMRERQLLHQNQILQKQLLEIQGILQATKTESNVSPTEECDFSPATEFLPSTSFAPLHYEGPGTASYVGHQGYAFFPPPNSASPIATDDDQHTIDPPYEDLDTYLSVFNWVSDVD